MKDAIGTFDQIVSRAPQHAELLHQVRGLVMVLHPTCIEVARPGDRAVSWGWGPRKMSEAYASALPYAGHVNLAFYRGAMLPDPMGMLRGTGKAMRHVSITQAAQVGHPAIRALLIAAREERRDALGLEV